MIRVALKDVLGRKLRLILTSLAIVMGVAMVSGTFILTDTINGGFKTIFTTANAGSDAVITGKEVFGGSDNAPPFPESTLTKVRGLPGVSEAEGGVGGRTDEQVRFIGRNGKEVGGTGGAPGLAFSVESNGDPRFNPLVLVSGAWPSGPHEIAMDQHTASSQHYAIGDPVGAVASQGKTRQYRMTGIVRFENSASIGGATIAIFDVPTAQALFGEKGQLDQIDVAAKSGVSKASLLAQIETVLPPHTKVETGEEHAKSETDEISSQLAFIRYFLLAFGGIALFVGAFVIANTLSITIAQRTREFATLRCVGASGRQVLGVVALEGALTGLVASVVGLFVGLGLAKGLDAMFKAFGADLPESGLVFAERTVILSLVVGTVVTLLASIRPAIRATRVPPISAVREGSVLPPSRLARFGPAASIGVCAISIALMGWGAFGSGSTGGRLLLFGIGVLSFFVGAAMVSPKLARPLASVLGRPAAMVGGVAGELARSNSMRNPSRTASTAAALMIGLALVTTVSVLAQGVRAAIQGNVKQQFNGDYALTSQNGFEPTSVDSSDALRKSGLVTVAAGLRAGDGRLFGKSLQVGGAEPGLSKVLNLKWSAGSNASLEHLGTNGAIVSKDYAKSHHLDLGSPLRLETPAGKFISLRLAAIVDPPKGGSALAALTISAAAFDSVYPNPQNVFTLVKVHGGVTPATTAKLNRLLRTYPDAKIQTQKEFVDAQIAGLNQFVALLYILLGLSIIVSLFGIVNTLVLTVFERTREIGMLRAVGMTRRQTRRMIRHESVITALLGAALGIPIGLGLGALVDKALRGIPFAVPVGTIVIFVVAAIIVGLLAAIFPARRASRLNVLEALQYE
ncbi:MAG TPA: FtsX-like permease family protein [Gaiellaceae bacterium]